MKKRLFNLVLILSTLAFFNATASHQGRIGYSGGPQETNCTQCHNSYALNSGPGSVTITSDMAGWQYVPGQTYTISLTVQQTGMQRFGMAFEANKDTGMIGTLTSMSPTDSITIWRTRTITFNGTGGHVKYGMTHNRWNIAPAGQPVQYYYPATAPDTYTWNFKWTAPVTNEGQLTFWFTGLACDSMDDQPGDYTYTSSQVINPVVPMILNCATNATEAACQSQAAINAAFFTWLTTATVSGGCNTVLTNDATTAPLACGGSVLVTWTATSTCGPTETCSATFTVDAAAPVVLNCIGNQSLPFGQTQATVDAAYAVWLSSTNFTGGCNGVLANNSTGAPLASGGSTTVTFTVTSDCETDVTCNATFTVNGPPPPVLTAAPATGLFGFKATLAIPSAAKTLVVSGTNLVKNIVVVAPAQFEVSLTGLSGSWKVQVIVNKDLNNQVLPTNVFVRFKPTALGWVTGKIKLQSLNAVTVKVQVKGECKVARLENDLTASDVDVTLTPNPVVNSLNLTFNNMSENVTVSVYSAAGNLIQSQVGNTSAMLLDVSELPQGMYICRIESGTAVITKRFVKQ